MLLQPSLVASAMPPVSIFVVPAVTFVASAANTLTLLIKISAVVTVYRGHRRTLFFSAQNYLSVHHVHRNCLR